MTTPPSFPGFDGLMTLSRREGVDIRPTLLRVLTDLYVQADAHSADEERQFIELTSRLIDEVDDATRAAVRARLAIYPATPAQVLEEFGLKPVPANACRSSAEIRAAPSRTTPVQPPTRKCGWRRGCRCSQRTPPKSTTFSRGQRQRTRLDPAQSSRNPIRASARMPAARAARAIETLEMAAFAATSRISRSNSARP